MIGAGEWIVAKGKLERIGANSGHSQPTIDHLVQSVRAMAKALQADTTVTLRNSQQKAWEDVPVRKFRQDPSQGGIMKAHASA